MTYGAYRINTLARKLGAAFTGPEYITSQNGGSYVSVNWWSNGGTGTSYTQKMTTGHNELLFYGDNWFNTNGMVISIITAQNTSTNDRYVIAAVARSDAALRIYRQAGGTGNWTRLTLPGSLSFTNVNQCSKLSVNYYNNIPYVMVGGNLASTYCWIAKLNGSSVEATALSGIASVVNAVSVSPDGIYFAVGHNNSPYVSIFKRFNTTDTYTKLSNPATLPFTSVTAITWNHDGSSLYCGYNYATNKSATIYNRSGDTFTAIANPPLDTNTTGANWAEFSHDGSRLAIVSGTSPYIYIFNRSGDTFTKQTNPASIPTAAVQTIKWKPGDSSQLAYSHTLAGSAHAFGVYDRSTDTYTLKSSPADPPLAYGNNNSARSGLDWMRNNDGSYNLISTQAGWPYYRIWSTSGSLSVVSPTMVANDKMTKYINSAKWNNDGTSLALTKSQGEYIEFYNRSGTSLSQISTGTSLSGVGYHLDWSPNGTYVAVATGSTSVSVLKRAGDSFSALTSPTNPAGTWLPQRVAWSPDNTYLVVGASVTNFLAIYKRTNDTFAALSNPATLPTGAVIDIKWSPDGNYVLLVQQSSPYIRLYSRSGDTFTLVTNPATLPNSSSSRVAWKDNNNFIVSNPSSSNALIYNVSGSTLTYTTSFTPSPSMSQTICLQFNSTGSKLVYIGNNTISGDTNFVDLYSVSGTTYTKQSTSFDFISGPSSISANYEVNVYWGAGDA